MLRSIVISPDSDLIGRLESFLSEVGQIGVARKIAGYPDSVELTRVIRAHAPQVVFLGLDSVPKAAAVAAAVEKNTPGVQFVAIHRTCDPTLLLEAMRMGVREFLSPPFSRQTFFEMLARLQEGLQKMPPSIAETNLLFAFLPAKAGVGTTTLALNTAASMARQPNTHVLLSDLDLNSGMIRFMLKLDNQYSIMDAAEHAAHLDEALWPQLVSHLDRLDILHAGRLNPNFRIEAIQLTHLLDFARRNYQGICVDLSGNLEKYSVEVMHESKRVFLVCTPEIPSLHLAREKYQYLQTLDLADRVSLLVNRTQKRSSVTSAQIEQLLGVPVMMSFPNDYQTVQRALQDGTVVEPGSELGKQYTHFARMILGTKTAAAADQKRKLSELFSIVPGKFSIFPENKKSTS